MSCNSTPLQLPVEALQKACPRLQVSMPYLPSLAIRPPTCLQPVPPPDSQVLRLLNLIWLPKPCGRGVPQGPGFPSLEELCLAGSTCSFVSNEVLGRLLHCSPKLRLLDLRGCARITPAGLCDLPCQGQLAWCGRWRGAH